MACATVPFSSSGVCEILVSISFGRTGGNGGSTWLSNTSFHVGDLYFFTCFFVEAFFLTVVFCETPLDSFFFIIMMFNVF